MGRTSQSLRLSPNGQKQRIEASQLADFAARKFVQRPSWNAIRKAAGKILPKNGAVVAAAKALRVPVVGGSIAEAAIVAAWGAYELQKPAMKKVAPAVLFLGLCVWRRRVD